MTPDTAEIPTLFSRRELSCPGLSDPRSSDQGASDQGISSQGFIQVEISVETIRRLIFETKLAAEDFHCMNSQSKNIIRKALLDSTMKPLRKL